MHPLDSGRKTRRCITTRLQFTLLRIMQVVYEKRLVAEAVMTSWVLVRGSCSIVNHSPGHDVVLHAFLSEFSYSCHGLKRMLRGHYFSKTAESLWSFKEYSKTKVFYYHEWSSHAFFFLELQLVILHSFMNYKHVLNVRPCLRHSV